MAPPARKQRSQDRRRRQQSADRQRQPQTARPSHNRRPRAPPPPNRRRAQTKTTKDELSNKAPESFKGDVPSGSKGLEDMPAHIRAFVDELTRKGPTGCRAEFATNRAYVPKEAEANAFKANVERNRYRDVMCLDNTRIELKHYETTNYIHANMVKGGNITFICCQGPLEHTINDFWHMVWQCEVQQIVMLCDLVENGREKCAPYWPRKVDEKMKCGEYQVCKVRELPVEKVKSDGQQKEQIVHSTLEITKEGFAPRTVYHRHWEHWSDRGAPIDTKALILLRNLCAETAVGQPVVVHCSAGIGRTGTMVLLDVVAQQLELGEPVDMVANLQRLRDQRVHSVQTDVQYTFIYKAMLDYIQYKWQLKATPEIDKFNADYAAMYNIKK